MTDEAPGPETIRGRWWKFGWVIVALLVAQAAFWASQLEMARWVVVGNEVYFVDGDCYSRMQRVKMIEAGPVALIKQHDFENFPEGTEPHTTAPLDYLILGFSRVLPSSDIDPRDLAGAWISPLLGSLLLTGLAIGGGILRLRLLPAVLLLTALCPILQHGFAVGRPDHQSLVILLIGMGWLAEVALWRGRTRGWNLVWGISWGLALWVSLFEPPILLGLTLLARGLGCGRSGFQGVNLLGPAITLGFLLFSFVLEGWPKVSAGGADMAEFLLWSQTIGELQQSNPFVVAMIWIGLLGPVLPILLAVGFFRERDRRALFFGGLILLLGALLCWHGRWGYFFGLAGVLSLPWALGWIRPVWLAWLLFVVSLWPLGVELERTLFPEGEFAENRADRLQEAAHVRQLVSGMEPGEGSILAPWWISPAINYWSGRPCVAGSSHQSLPGNRDSSAFFLSSDFELAFALLEKRKVDYVVLLDGDRVAGQSASVLGVESADPNCLARVLHRNPSGAPDYLTPIRANARARLYQVHRPIER